MNRNYRKRGIIQLLAIILIAILILSFFGFDLREIVEAEQTQKNFSYVWSLAVSLWDNVLKVPILYFWNDIFIDLFWNSFVSNFERLRDGQPTDFELDTPAVNLE